MSVQVVWFKRDLRIADHHPLVEASKRGPVVCLYVYEPSVWLSTEMDPSHLVFVNESLAQLNQLLAKRGGRVTFRVGEMPDVLGLLEQELGPLGGIGHLWSHQEIGNGLTFERDKRVQRWCRAKNVPWTEIPQDGVFRGEKDRQHWGDRWQEWMEVFPIHPPEYVQDISDVAREWCHQTSHEPQELGWRPSTKSNVQKGGELEAWATLHSFFQERGKNYRVEMSSPERAWHSCSRMSPYLAWGNISLRTVHHETKQALLGHYQQPYSVSQQLWVDSLRSFQKRLRWRSHFMQKLDDQPSIEFENINSGFNGLRESDFREDWFQAWCEGQTGYPLVDACMRCLHQTGWINFRMRALLVSFATHHLWLHWRKPALFLARHFLDYEPGIHYSQFQMQAGTTGINTLRVYSPVKQAEEQDPEGIFIRRYVPELEGMPGKEAIVPHQTPVMMQHMYGCVIGRDYPLPIIDHEVSGKLARVRLHERKQSKASQQEIPAILAKHVDPHRPRRMR